MSIAFSYAARSDVGMVRKNNQDSGYAGPHLLVVADGMGGHAGGDIASSTVISELVSIDHESLTAGEASEQLSRAIATANAELAHAAEERPELEGLGTTVTALMRARNKLILAHIGDSRCYLLRERKFTQITHDHSFVQTLIDEGRITEEEASTHPQRSVVTRVLTGDPGDEPDVGAREAIVGDRYLLCSDGLSGFVAGDTIEDLLRAGKAPGATADELVALALKAGAPDNVTVIVADVVDLNAVETPPSTQPQVVGSAALRQERTRPIANSPAAKAAALSSNDEAPTQELQLAEEEQPGALGRWAKRLGVLAVVALIVGALGYGGWSWTQNQYYVGAEDSKVTIYQGINQALGPIQFSHAVRQTDIPLGDLPGFYRSTVEETVAVESLDAAEQRVDSLRVAAVRCAQLRESGQEC